VSLIVLLVFLLNNVYIWFSLRDKAVLYFLIAQLGALIYITAYKQFFYVLFPHPFTIGLVNGSVVQYGLNSLFLHAGCIIILYGLVHFCRSYLNTRRSFPWLDHVLRNELYVYVVLGSLCAVINAFVYLENYTWFVDNIFGGLFIAAIIYISVKGYIRKLPAATPFLIANILSLGFMLATVLFHLIADLSNRGYSPAKSLLPDIAIITQTIGFSVALVARTRLLQNSLAAKEIEARQLELDLREISLRHQQIELENETISTEMKHQKTRNEQLQEKLETNQRELASSTMYIVQKNELLAKLKDQIKELKKQYPDNKYKGLQDIESTLQSSLHLEDGWEKFKLHFEQVHPHFFEELKAKHPKLTKNEIRLCAYFHINLSTKEIASLLNIDPASVRRAKTRLYKKMGNSTKASEEDD
jgi:DNA-binding CsgD family transcriptional regulator